MQKRCGTCRETLPISAFRVDRKRKDGLSPRCVPCANEAEAASYLRLKMRTVEHLGGRCRTCGYAEDHRAFAFDHVTGGGSRARTAGMLGRKLLNAVLAGTAGQIQLLCWNCNTIKRVQEDERGARVYLRTAPPPGIPGKRCPRCEATKPSSEFAPNSARHDGLSSYCRPCANAYQRDHYKTLRARTVAHLGGQCRTCGYHEDTRALVIDHINGGGGRQRTAGRVMARFLRDVLADVSNEYQLLCANCNQIKQFEAGERLGKRTYKRIVPTERIDRPDIRTSPEWAATFKARVLACWEDPEFRARQSAQRSARMTARWASGEDPTRRRRRSSG